jgi:uncharacterized protein (DUF169 family)
MSERTTHDWRALVGELNALLRLRTTVIGMKLFERVEDMEAVPRIRRPKAVHTTDQVVSMASRLGWTVGITAEDLVANQCRAVIGLGPQDEAWRSGREFVGMWHATPDDARRRQEAQTVVPYGRYRAMAVSPLEAGRLDPPDICLVYATPGQMILFINGLQWTGYRKFDWSVGVPDDEMLMALPPRFLPVAIEGMQALAKNGIRYPIAPYGIQNDVRAGLAAGYQVKQ